MSLTSDFMSTATTKHT